jgi:hypothetical protein
MPSPARRHRRVFLEVADHDQTTERVAEEDEWHVGSHGSEHAPPELLQIVHVADEPRGR